VNRRTGELRSLSADGSRLAAHEFRVGTGALTALLLACCTTPPVDDGRREATIPVVAPVAPRARRQVIHTTWSFESGSDACIAVAAAGATSLRVTVGRDLPIRLTLSLSPQLPPAGRAAVPLHFAGPTGSWQVSAQQAGPHRLAVTLGADDTALSRILVLLGGGVLDVGVSEQIVASIDIMPSDARGQLWFDCARGKMI
jgi:hypothetical protein